MPGKFLLLLLELYPGGDQDNQQAKDGADEHAREDPKRDPDPAAASLDQEGAVAAGPVLLTPGVCRRPSKVLGRSLTLRA